MLIQDLNKLWRKQVSDEEQPYLWDDDEFLQYLIDAQDTFVRITGGFSDSTTTALTDIPVVTDEPFAYHSPYILRIRSAKMLSDWHPVKMISEADIGLQTTNDYGLQIPGEYLKDTDTGVVNAGILGMEELGIRWWKVPNADDTCRLHIYRLPYPRIATTEDTLEIPEQHHLALLMWVKKHAYSKEDAETYDRDLAERNEKKFIAYCETARDELERQRYKPRTVQYGGI